MVSMLGKPVTNPTVPYVGPIASSLSPGKFIRILGTVSSVGKQFFTNLQCGSSHFDDIALHISVFLNEGRIITKYQQFGTWDGEQIYENTEISRGKQFEILVICELTVFKIGINGQHLCEFPHKIPYEKISHVRVEGNVSVSQISVEAQPTVTSPVIYSQSMNSAPPPYPGATAPPTNTQHPYPSYPPPKTSEPAYPPPLNSAPQQPVYPNTNPYLNHNVQPAGTYPYNPLLPQQTQMLPPQPLPSGAINAMPRAYQAPSWQRWGSEYRGNRKMAYIGFAVFAAFSVLSLIIFLILFFKGQREFDEVRRKQEEFHKKYFGDR